MRSHSGSVGVLAASEEGEYVRGLCPGRRRLWPSRFPSCRRRGRSGRDIPIAAFRIFFHFEVSDFGPRFLCFGFFFHGGFVFDPRLHRRFEHRICLACLVLTAKAEFRTLNPPPTERFFRVSEDREAARRRIFRNESFAGGYSRANFPL